MSTLSFCLAKSLRAKRARIAGRRRSEGMILGIEDAKDLY